MSRGKGRFTCDHGIYDLGVRNLEVSELGRSFGLLIVPKYLCLGFSPIRLIL